MKKIEKEEVRIRASISLVVCLLSNHFTHRKNLLMKTLIENSITYALLI